MEWIISSQTEMEAAMRAYFSTLTTTQAGEFNAMLSPEFLSCDFDRRTLRVALHVQPWMLNPRHILHGGIGSATADFVMGVLSRICSGGALTPTVSMTVDYLHSVRAGDTLVMEAVCVKAGHSLCALTAVGWVEGAPDRLVLSASGTYFVSDFEA